MKIWRVEVLDYKNDWVKAKYYGPNVYVKEYEARKAYDQMTRDGKRLLEGTVEWRIASESPTD